MSGLVTAVSAIANLATVALEVTMKVQQISLIVQKAQTEGRDLTDDELAKVRSMDDEARQRLEAAINAGGGMSHVDILKRDLEVDEGRVAHAYQDSLGYWTIGVGRLIDKRLGGRLRDDEIDLMLINDIQEAEDIARALVANFDSLSDERKAVVCNMAHNLGKTRLAEFKNTLTAINEGRFDDAADGMLASKWAGQVGARALRLSAKMRSG